MDNGSRSAGFVAASAVGDENSKTISITVSSPDVPPVARVRAVRSGRAGARPSSIAAKAGTATRA